MASNGLAFANVRVQAEREGAKRRAGGPGGWQGQRRTGAPHIVAILHHTWGGVHIGAYLGAHSPMPLTTNMLALHHSPLPCLCTTCPSHINTCMPHASIACSIRPTSATCCVCVTGHRLIFIGSHRGPAPKTRSASGRFSVVRDRKNIVAQQSRLVWCWWH